MGIPESKLPHFTCTTTEICLPVLFADMVMALDCDDDASYG